MTLRISVSCAQVKRVNRKQKKASIVFVDQALTGVRRHKGYELRVDAFLTCITKHKMPTLCEFDSQLNVYVLEGLLWL